MGKRTSFREADVILDKIASYVLDDSQPRGAIVILPVAFGEDAFADALVARLHRSKPEPAIARIFADLLSSRDDYLRRLHHAWEPYHVPAPSRRNGNTALDFESYLGQLPRTRPFVQIITRFHKFLSHLDQFILGSLRSAEQSQSLRTVVLSPYNYDDLRVYWQEFAERLTISNYGDKHVRFQAAPLDDEELQSLHPEIPGHVLDFMIEASGGIPEILDEMILHWHHDSGRPMTHGRREELSLQALPLARRFVAMLDAPGRTQVRDAVARLLLNPTERSARSPLEAHPWRTTLLGPSGLRSRLVGRAAVDLSIGSDEQHAFEVGRRAYQARRWDEAERILETVRHRAGQLLRYHAQAMAALGSEVDAVLGAITNSRQLRHAIEQARTIAAASQFNDEILDGRYAELLKLAETCGRLSRIGVVRIVDALAGLDPRVPRSAEDAILALLGVFQHARTTSSNYEAVQCALAVPEQAFRVFAFWQGGVREDAAPVWSAEDAESYADIAAFFPGTSLVRPQTGARFGSFVEFALFVVARVIRRGQLQLPWKTLKAFHTDLTRFQVRRDGAHSVSHVPASRRDDYLKFAEGWINLLFLPSDVAPQGFQRSDFEARLEPLPCVDWEGRLEWVT